MTEDVVEAAKAALELTKGWIVFSGYVCDEVDKCTCAGPFDIYGHRPECGLVPNHRFGDSPADELAEAARSLIPELVAEVERLRAKLDEQTGAPLYRTGRWRMILSLIRFPLACIGQAVDIAMQMRAHNKLVAALNAAQPETLNGRMPQEKDPAEVTASGTASAGHPQHDCGAGDDYWLGYPGDVRYCRCGQAWQLADNGDWSRVPPDSATVAAGADTGAPSHTNLVELIVEVLDAHEGHWNRDAAMYECLERVDDADRGFRLVTVGDDYQGWLRHVAPLIAERIEKATPPVVLSPEDWRLAYSAIYGYALSLFVSMDEAVTFTRADLLHAEADPTP